jgi:uroporphyrin-III C-methyltransferase
VNGRVTLVGAGPGDPELLTRRAVARLRSAELVLYDALVDERILRFARRAQKFYVGKRAGRHAMTQEAINALMVRAARRGRRVVRLKGGDPFVFGRGGEEVLALQRAGIAHEVVPGISSAIAAPAAAGIPVTHRGVSTAFLVVSGHDEKSFSDATAGLAPNRLTLVVLMGLGRASAVAWNLLNNCWSRGTPAAIVTDASTPAQRVWRGTLDDLAAERHVLDVTVSSAGTIVVGDVVTVNMQAALDEAIACGS